MKACCGAAAPSTTSSSSNPLALQALEERDRALVRMLAATVLRRLGTLKRIVGAMLESPLPKEIARVDTALLLGAAQILFLDVPDHAAVDLSVRLVQAEKHAARYAGLVNAVLRRIAREGKRDARHTRHARARHAAMADDALDASITAPTTARAIAAANVHEPALDLTVKSDPRDVGAASRRPRDAERQRATGRAWSGHGVARF